MTLLDGLSWNASEELQKQVRNSIIKELGGHNLAGLILPFARKDCWDNCALIFDALDDVHLRAYIPGLFTWLKDMYWPGAIVIAKRLLRYECADFADLLNQAITRARTENDEEWLYFLNYVFIERGDFLLVMDCITSKRGERSTRPYLDDESYLYKGEKDMTLLDGLSWNASEELQKQVRNSIIKEHGRHNLAGFILPFARKDCWDNCALIFDALDDVHLRAYIPELFTWLKDMNWPGGYHHREEVVAI